MICQKSEKKKKRKKEIKKKKKRKPNFFPELVVELRASRTESESSTAEPHPQSQNKLRKVMIHPTQRTKAQVPKSHVKTTARNYNVPAKVRSIIRGCSHITTL